MGTWSFTIEAALLLEIYFLRHAPATTSKAARRDKAWVAKSFLGCTHCDRADFKTLGL